jgi:hypothetical protein
VIVGTTSGNPPTVQTRVLSWNELALLLAELRKLAQTTPRAQAVDSAALHAFVSALARLLHSPGPIPFCTAAFGNIWQELSGDIVGEIALSSDVVGTICVEGDNLYYEQHALGKPSGPRRLLSIGQLLTLITALQMQTANTPTLSRLWANVLSLAIKKNEQLKVTSPTQ